MISLKKYFLSIIILSSIALSSFSLTREYYRSNSNGLMLLKIQPDKIKNFSYIVLVDTSGDLVYSKILYKDNSETKRWTYTYTNNIMDSEYYYKGGELSELSKYDNLGHKISLDEYLSGKIFKRSTFTYNKDGVVDREEIYNYMSRETNVLKYKYDRDFRIKQIEKRYPDKTVYWESFYTDKGIILKEYYSLNDEMYTFFYNQNGQELKGEVKQILPDKTEKIKISWENFFTKDGLKERKEEEDFELDTRTITWYYKNAKEKRIESYLKGDLASVEEYEYNDKDKISYYKKVFDLNLLEIYYKYDKNNALSETSTYEDKVMKKSVRYNPDGTRVETVYSKSKMKLSTTYDKDGKVIKQD
jgi:hypothetical protein